uniref:Uncharacterized protein n=1 Tax=viral metagenome TaxID=1070528 RepID=A0A6C0BQB5_9ZZZZ
MQGAQRADIDEKALITDLKATFRNPNVSSVIDMTIQLMEIAAHWTTVSGFEKRSWVIRIIQEACTVDQLDQWVPHLIDILCETSEGKFTFKVPQSWVSCLTSC